MSTRAAGAALPSDCLICDCLTFLYMPVMTVSSGRDCITYAEFVSKMAHLSGVSKVLGEEGDVFPRG